MSSGFAGRTLIVTGGAGGIGRAIVTAALNRGMHVVALDRDAANAARLEASLDAAALERLSLVSGDVGNQDIRRETIVRALAAGGGEIHCLVNNVGFSRRGILSDARAADVLEVLTAGPVAAYDLARLMLPHLGAAAAIVNIASSRAFQSQRDGETYAMAKGALTALTHALAASLAGRCRVNSVSPGWIDTTGWHADDHSETPRHSAADRLQHSSGRVGCPEDIARAVLFLLDPANSFINGQNLTVDGGMGKLMIYHDDEGWSYQPPSS